MPSSEEQQLLHDVLRDADYAAFRAEVYEMSLAEFNADRRRPVTVVFLAVAAVALVAVLIVLALRTEKELRPNPQVVTVAPSANNNNPGLFLLKSSPLPPNEVVRSVADQSQIVETQAGSLAMIPFVRSNPATLSPMQDTELLALFTSDSVGFLRTGKGESLYYFAIGRRSRLE
jgi:hypothetical protein